jgi:cardiolipin synthase A/B
MTDPRAAADELARLAASPPRGRTEVRVLRNGVEAFPAMLEAIAGARQRVRFENFIFAGDTTGRRFAEALSAAAKRGVDVQVLYDPIGTMMVRGGSIADVLRRAGVTARPFQPLSPFAPWSWLRLRHRDHRKTLTVDGQMAFVGGLCISDNWSPSEKGGRGWRDTALRVRGPIARDVERAFEGLWQSSKTPPAPAPPTPDESSPAVAVLAQDLPGSGRVASIYKWLARTARETLEITDSYLVAPPIFLEALEGAARRGVSVRILLPGRNNHPVAGAAARWVYERLLAAGVGIFEWEGVMIHAKTAVADGKVSLVGSSNLDPLSMRLNFELNLAVVDAGTGQEMQRMFERDLSEARPVLPTAWNRRPLWQKAAERAAALVGGRL